MLQQPCRLLLDELRDHIAEHRAHSVETLVGSTYVVQSMIVEEDLLDNEDSDSLAELRSRLHDPKAKWNDLGCQEEVNDIR